MPGHRYGIVHQIEQDPKYVVRIGEHVGIAIAGDVEGKFWRRVRGEKICDLPRGLHDINAFTVCPTVVDRVAAQPLAHDLLARGAALLYGY